VPDSRVLTEPFELSYVYKRSLGPVLQQFFEALRERRVLGARTASGRVLMPPSEYDPDTGEAIEALVPLPETGVVTSWSWVAEPADGEGLERPFAWALIRLDGADTAMLHALDAGSPEAVSTGMAVRIRWADAPSGGIRDIACFVPADAPADAPVEPPADAPDREPLKFILHPTRISYTIQADPVRSQFLLGLADKRLMACRCHLCEKVYVPARATCPTCGVICEGEDIDLPDTGVVTTFCVISIPFQGQVLKPPYACAHILLDGADVPLFQIVGGCDAADIRAGMRVRGVWAPDAELTPTWESLRWFEPTGEPDAPAADWEQYV